MTAYASVPAYVDHKLHPRVLALIIVGHAGLIGALMLAKMDLPPRMLPKPITVYFPTQPTPPPPRPMQQPKSQQPQARSIIDHPQQMVQIPLHTGPEVDNTPTIPSLTPIIPVPVPNLTPSEPVRTGPRFATPESELKPPYPQEKELASIVSFSRRVASSPASSFS